MVSSPEPPLRGRIDKKLQGLPHVEKAVEAEESQELKIGFRLSSDVPKTERTERAMNQLLNGG